MISIADMVASGTATATKTYCKVILPCARKPTNRGQLPGAALPNAASVALHERLGFEHVATFRQVGFKHDRWVDVAYWQLLL